MYCVKVCGTGGRRINGGDEMIGEYVIIWHMLKSCRVTFFNNLFRNRLVRGESTEDSEEVVPGERDDERERWRRRRLRLSLRFEDCLGGVVADNLGWVSWLADDLDWVSMTEYPVGTKIRKKFGNNRYFNGIVVSFDRTEKEWTWHVKHSDGDSEDLSENELKECVQLYNTCKNE